LFDQDQILRSRLCKFPDILPAPLFGSCNLAQGPRKKVAIDGLFGTSVITRVEAAIGQPTQPIFEVKKNV